MHVNKEDKDTVASPPCYFDVSENIIITFLVAHLVDSLLLFDIMYF